MTIHVTAFTDRDGGTESASWTTLVSTYVLSASSRDSTISDHGVDVDEIPQPHRLAERGW